MFPKAAASEADAVCLDLEDSVLADEKAAAPRQRHPRAQRGRFGRRVRMVRINSLDSDYAERDVTDVMEAAGEHVDLVMVPKVASTADVAFVDDLLTRIETARTLSHRVGIEAQIESAAGFSTCARSRALSPRLESLIFGPGDFAASMQMPASAIGELDAHDAAYPGHRYHAVMLTIVAARPRQRVALHGRPVRRLHGHSRADSRMRDCHRARLRWQAVHPSGQLATVNAAFSPSDEEVARASALVKAYESAIAEGRGAASLQGRMIDAASLRMAQVTCGGH
jgi:citrate lyase subunit beta/citryl-CoA lyase